MKTEQPQSERLANGTLVFTTEDFRIQTDALLLAGFCRTHRQDTAVDLGAGCGVLLLALADKGLRGPSVFVEQQEAAAALCRLGAQQNGLAGFSVVCGDLRAYTPPRQFDLALANPPYFAAGPPSPKGARALARHEQTATLAEVCGAAGRCVRQGGRFCLCLPPARLEGLFAALKETGFAPKRMRFVKQSPQAAPWLVLTEAVKSGGEGLDILPDLILDERL